VKDWLLRAALIVALAVPAAAGAQHRRAGAHQAAVHRAPAHRAPATRDWTRVVVATPEGGFRMGNPAAATRLVEYGSISCPHCAAFAADGAPTIRDSYVRSGRLSWEYRPYLLFPTDPGLFMLLRCQGAAGFFPSIEQLYATQATWIGRLRSAAPDEIARLRAMTPIAQSAGLMQLIGVDAFFRQRGMTQARIDACLADQASLEALAERTRDARVTQGVPGTPTFFINGQIVPNVFDWAALRPHLPAL
jgi:protein-disulfide isomerase